MSSSCSRASSRSVRSNSRVVRVSFSTLAVALRRASSASRRARYAPNPRSSSRRGGACPFVQRARGHARAPLPADAPWRSNSSRALDGSTLWGPIRTWPARSPDHLYPVRRQPTLRSTSRRRTQCTRTSLILQGRRTLGHRVLADNRRSITLERHEDSGTARRGVTLNDRPQWKRPRPPPPLARGRRRLEVGTFALGAVLG